jgi:hypothetical protein
VVVEAMPSEDTITERNALLQGRRQRRIGADIGPVEEVVCDLPKGDISVAGV